MRDQLEDGLFRLLHADQQSDELASHAGSAATAFCPFLAHSAHNSPDEPAERLERVDDADGVVAAQVVDALREQPVQVRPSAAGVGGQGFRANL